MVQDPVCETLLNEEQTRHWVTYQDQEYWFCSAECKRAFLLQPDRYAFDQLQLEEVTIDWDDDPGLPERPAEG